MAKTLTFPQTPVLAMVDFQLCTALVNILVNKGIITAAEQKAVYSDAADALSNTPDMDEAKALLRGLAAASP
jgi:hypothetical protein